MMPYDVCPSCLDNSIAKYLCVPFRWVALCDMCESIEINAGVPSNARHWT